MTPALERRPYGRTDEHVTVIGLGGAALAQNSLADGVATVRRALDLGITYFDTSPAYARGASQVILGTTLEGRPEQYLLATKLGYLASPADFRSPDALRAQLWENLRTLRRDSVDVLQVHIAERASWWKDEAPDDEAVDLNEAYDFDNAPVMEVLLEAKVRGVCRFIGVTADSAAILVHILHHVEVDVCLVAYEYNLMFRRARPALLPLTQERGVACVVGAIFKPWFVEVRPEWLSAPPPWITPEIQRRLPQLYDLQRESRLSLVTLGVRFLVGDPQISTILVGAASPAELEESVAAAEDGPLPDELHEAVEALGIP